MTNLKKRKTLSKVVLMTDNFWDTKAFASSDEPKYAVNDEAQVCVKDRGIGIKLRD